jgi:hypothetical protein
MTLEDRLFTLIYHKKETEVDRFREQWQRSLDSWQGRELSGLSNLVLIGANRDSLFLLDTDQKYLQEFPIHRPQCWLPDGSGLVFLIDHLNPLGNEGQEPRKTTIIGARFDGSLTARISMGLSPLAVSYAPDYRSLLALSNPGTSSTSSLYVYSFGNDKAVKICSGVSSGPDEPFSAIWNPDSRYIVYKNGLKSQGKTNEIWVCRSDGAQQHMLTKTESKPGGFISNPTIVIPVFFQYSPLGENNRDSLPNGTYCFNILGTQNAELLTEDNSMYNVEVSPDKKKMFSWKHFAGETASLEIYSPLDKLRRTFTFDSHISHQFFNPICWTPDSNVVIIDKSYQHFVEAAQYPRDSNLYMVDIRDGSEDLVLFNGSRPMQVKYGTPQPGNVLCCSKGGK